MFGRGTRTSAAGAAAGHHLTPPLVGAAISDTIERSLRQGRPGRRVGRGRVANRPRLALGAVGARDVLRTVTSLETRHRLASGIGSLRTAGSVASWRSRGSVLSHRSVGSVASSWSLLSAGSWLSIGSVGSILSIGSAGSVLSIGSSGSILSIGAAGGFLSLGRPVLADEDAESSEARPVPARPRLIS